MTPDKVHKCKEKTVYEIEIRTIWKGYCSEEDRDD